MRQRSCSIYMLGFNIHLLQFYSEYAHTVLWIKESS